VTASRGFAVAAWLESRATVAVALVAVAACAAPASRPPPTSAQRLNGDGLRQLDRGDLTGAELLFRDALRGAELVDDLTSEAEAWNNLGSLATTRGNAQEALMDHVSALRAHRASGVRDVGEVRTRSNLGGVLLRLGKSAEAKAQFREAVALGSQLRVPAASRLARVGLGSVSLAEGDAAAALRVAGEVSDEARRDGDPSALAASLSLGGAALERTGDLGGASARYGEALSLDRAREQPTAVAGDLRDLSRVAERAGDRAGAAALLARSARIAWDLGQVDEAERELARAVVLAAGGAPDEEGSLRRELDEMRAARARRGRP